MICQMRKTTLLVLIAYLGSILSYPLQSHAITGGTTSTKDLKTSLQCGDFCPKFGKRNSPGGLSSGSIWGTEDDALCANMGSPTSKGYVTASPTPNPNYGDCSVMVTDQFLARFGTGDKAGSCTKAGEILDHCTYHNSQVENYCMAYNAVDDKESGSYILNGVMLGLTTTAAATCLAACVTINPGAEQLCGAAGALVGAGEIGAMIAQSTGVTQNYIEALNYISGIGGAVGAAAGVGTFAAGYAQEGVETTAKTATSDLAKSKGEADLFTKQASDLKTHADSLDQKAKDLADEFKTVKDKYNKAIDKALDPHLSTDEFKKAKAEVDELNKASKAAEKKASDAAAKAKEARGAADDAGKKAKDAADDVATKAGKKEAADGAKNSKDRTSRIMACATAATFGVLAGLRTINLMTMKKIKEDSCDKVNSLMSKSPSTSGDTSGTGSNTISAGGTSGTGTGGSAGGSGNGTAGSTSAATPNQLETYDRCRGGGSSVADCMSASGISAAKTGGATDANLLTNPQVAQKLLEGLPSLKDLVKNAESGGAGAAMGSALPGGDASSALAALADAAQQKGGDLASQLGMGSGFTYSSGGGGGGSSSSKSDSPFGSLFGGGAAGGSFSGAGNSLTTFGSGPQAPDIWHSNTHQNLFEIISEKITKVSNRVSGSM